MENLHTCHLSWWFFLHANEWAAGDCLITQTVRGSLGQTTSTQSGGTEISISIEKMTVMEAQIGLHQNHEATHVTSKRNCVL